jgi:hypothetical protein
VLVTYRDPLTDDPNLMRNLKVSSLLTAKNNITRQQQRQSIATELERRRAPIYQRQADTLASRFGANVLPQRFSLVHALIAEMPLASILSLAADTTVLRIDPLRGDVAPAGCSPPTQSHVECGKWILGKNADLYRARHGQGRIALLDTGVWTGHCLFRTVPCPSSAQMASDGQVQSATAAPTQTGPISATVDCIPVDCRPDTRSDPDVHAIGHGTATAAILSGTEAMGQSHSGLTRAKLDTYSVYFAPTSASAESVGTAAAIAAFHDAVINQAHDLVVVEAAHYGGNGALTSIVNWAYRMSTAVISAAGNALNPTTPPEPADAPLGLAVGAYTIQGPPTYMSHLTHGSTADGRQKPEVGGPTGVLTARRGAEDALTSFGYTSGATPFVGGAALLLRNWMSSRGDYVPPGQLYAMLVLCGRNPAADQQSGSGLIRLPDDGGLFWFPLTIKHGQSRTVRLDAAGAASRMEAAIWWPEDPTDGSAHPAESDRSWIQLEVFGPGGSYGTSPSTRSVFRRITVPAQNQDRYWTVKVSGSWVPKGEQVVYFAGWVRPPGTP